MSKKFRICIGAILILDLFQRFQLVDIYYGQSGYFPQELAKMFYQGYWPSIELFENILGIKGIIFLTALTTLMYMGGLWYRFTGLLSFFLITSLNFRNPLILSGGDLLLRTILFWSLFFSEKKEEEDALVRFSYCCQLFIIYFFTTWLKILDPSWRNGDALDLILNNPLNATSLGLQLAKIKSLTFVLNYAVLVLEGFFSVILLCDFRTRFFVRPIAVLFILFHLCTAILMKLGLFPYVAIVAWLPVLFFKSEPSYTFNIPKGALSLFIIYVILMVNLNRIPGSFIELPRSIRKAVASIGLSQEWSMFSHPRSYVNELQMPAVMVDKSYRNIFPGINNSRDLKFFSNLAEERHPDLFAAFAKSICGLKVERFKIVETNSSAVLYAHLCGKP